MPSSSGDAPLGGFAEEKGNLERGSDSNHILHAEIDPKHDNGNVVDEEERRRLDASAKLDHPLASLTPEQLTHRGEERCVKHGLTDGEDIRAFRLGAMIAGNMSKYDVIDGLSDHERAVLDREITHRWSNTPMLYAVIVICSLCAAVQGMGETVVNGAQSFYKVEFGIGNAESQRDSWLLDLVNAAPYIRCAFARCWLAEPMNKALGRRGTIFISCVISALACFCQALTNIWRHMFIARFALGFGIDPKSATTPIFAAECSSPKLCGALVMQWQMWTAFGIMVGYAMDLTFFEVPDLSGIVGLRWRLMMGSALIPAVFVCATSPRWCLTKNRHQDAYKAITRLRFEKTQAACDLFYMDTLLQIDKEAVKLGQNGIKEFLTICRNRNAMLASEIVMFMQQFCGVNAIAYYSTEIFLDSGISMKSALAASLGFGIVNFLFALPAFYTIDTFGRRNLLLTTFSLMSLFLFFTGFSFWIPQSSTAHIGCITLAYPLYIRPIGMSLATATTWLFNSVISLTWPATTQAWTPQALLFVPETKEKTLEELDAVFDVPLNSIVCYGVDQFFYFWGHYILRLVHK
ncbi:hypothetical protein GGS23DRAFT_610562 [Durotheca rogersii]|uniref:uncharacterized protein n=1 Tax=Durotheca rogersii TaxID=419775 RepID=UPI002220F2F3|nr:uncharacterized protein GGS23DRAFT_610562 [Durotheca rogersii]KAI5862377.1 hypothetical protein GGS23DRAFT_610562 [Durotheca rogersii]